MQQTDDQREISGEPSSESDTESEEEQEEIVDSSKSRNIWNLGTL
jgi:hypothetical protein